MSEPEIHLKWREGTLGLLVEVDVVPNFGVETHISRIYRETERTLWKIFFLLRIVEVLLVKILLLARLEVIFVGLVINYVLLVKRLICKVIFPFLALGSEIFSIIQQKLLERRNSGAIRTLWRAKQFLFGELLVFFHKIKF